MWPSISHGPFIVDVVTVKLTCVTIFFIRSITALNDEITSIATAFVITREGIIIWANCNNSIAVIIIAIGSGIPKDSSIISFVETHE